MKRWVIVNADRFAGLVLGVVPALTGAALWLALMVVDAPINGPGLPMLPLFMIGGLIVGFIPACVSCWIIRRLERPSGVSTLTGVLVGAGTTGALAIVGLGLPFLAKPDPSSVLPAALICLVLTMCGAFAALLAVWIGSFRGIIKPTYFPHVSDPVSPVRAEWQGR